MTPRLTFTWSTEVACDLCNPAKLAHFDPNGVVVRGPTWRREVCVDCINTMEQFFVGTDVLERPLEQEVCDVFAAPGGATLALPTCSCGQALPARSSLASELRDALQVLLHMPDQHFELGVARVMFGVLTVASRLEHCDACSERRVASAFEAITAAALSGKPAKRRQPAIEQSRAARGRNDNGGEHGE